MHFASPPRHMPPAASISRSSQGTGPPASYRRRWRGAHNELSRSSIWRRRNSSARRSASAMFLMCLARSAVEPRRSAPARSSRTSIVVMTYRLIRGSSTGTSSWSTSTVAAGRKWDCRIVRPAEREPDRQGSTLEDSADIAPMWRVPYFDWSGRAPSSLDSSDHMSWNYVVGQRAQSVRVNHDEPLTRSPGKPDPRRLAIRLAVGLSWSGSQYGPPPSPV